MKKLVSLILFSAIALAATAQGFYSIASPNGRIKLTFELKDSVPYYSITFDDKAVVNRSAMGFELSAPWQPQSDYIVKTAKPNKKKEAYDQLAKGFEVANVDYANVDETWQPVLGEYENIRNNYNSIVIDLRQVSKQRNMKIEFRLFDAGIGFRYIFDKQENLSYFNIENELTQFAMTGNHDAFWIPGAYDSNEYVYQQTKLSKIDALAASGAGISTHGVWEKKGVQTPILMKASKNLYLNIFEAALVNFPAMQLLLGKDNKTFTAELVPSAIGTKAFVQTPFSTPWRTIMIADNAADMLCNNMILNLNEPSKIGVTDWIKPMKYVGIWWEMHVPNRSTWSYGNEPNVKLDGTNWAAMPANGRHGANTANVKRYIDFAAANGLDAVLIEGWNIGWEDWCGRWKEDVFDFVTPYPDFDIKEIAAYAASKKVKLIMHHETSASAINYERHLDEAYDLMHKYDYPAVKTGYVGRIIPRGEFHDGQFMVNHYNFVLEKAAKNKIMVDAHEPVRPTGLCRTYPNLLACEAARGNEFNAWSEGNPPSHETILPFTRLLGGGMDYTPGIFEIKMSSYSAGNICQVHTTLAKQLALYVTMYSPLQMAADLIENYEKRMDAFQFIKDVECDWLDTKVLEAEPGEYITIARKGKKTKNWFIGAITNEKKRKATIDLSFLEPDKKYVATVYADAADADWQANPQAYTINNYIVTNKTKEKVQLAAGGGCAISIREATAEDLKQYKKW